MSEKQSIIDHIYNGASLVEACEEADWDKLREEGDDEIADVMSRILHEAKDLVCLLGINDIPRSGE